MFTGLKKRADTRFKNKLKFHYGLKKSRQEFLHFLYGLFFSYFRFIKSLIGKRNFARGKCIVFLNFFVLIIAEHQIGS